MQPKRGNLNKKTKPTIAKKKKFRKPSKGEYKSNTKKQVTTLIAVMLVLGLLIVLLQAYKSGFFTPAAQDPNSPLQNEKHVDIEGIHKIKIYEATWGKNCHGKQVMKRFGIQDFSKGTYKVATNNVLAKIRDVCEGLETCNIQADSTALGLEPAENCSKTLVIKYRCFSYDKIREISVSEQGFMNLNCKS